MNTVNKNPHSNFLRLSLRGNAVFSTLSGLSFVFGNQAISSLLGEVPPIAVLSVGVQLLLFAGALFWLASRPVISAPLAVGVIVADLLWVVGTAIVVSIDFFAPRGETLALLLADVVLAAAILQGIGVRRMTGAASNDEAEA